MKSLISILAIAALLIAHPAAAASIQLAPTVVSVTPGQTFSVTVNANPEGVKIYTVKAIVNYPANLLEVTNFSIDSSWPLTPPGNSIDNASGKVTQSAGFTGGFTETKRFGTMTFRAKSAGSATISVVSGSAAYDAQSVNKIAGTQGASQVTIATPAPAPVVAEEEAAPVRPQVAASTAVAEEEPTDTESTSTPVVIAESDATATEQIAAAGLLESNWLYVVLGLVVLAALAAWLYIRRGRI